MTAPKKIPVAKAAKLAKVGKAVSPVLRVPSPLDVLKTIAGLKKVQLQEQTKIEAIRAHRDVAITALRQQRELILDICNRVFEERRGSLEKLFELLERSATQKDDKGLDIALQGIAAIVTTSPFMGFAAFVKAMRGGTKQIEL